MDTLMSKIRIVGLKYNKMQKQYKNMVFETNRDGSPAHTLFTLMNTGGKGVLLQALFQVIDPLIRWGKEDNRVESFFFGPNKKLVPYTFHVLIEWKVGLEPHTKLLTGVAITAKPKLGYKNDGSPIDLEYITYVAEQHEHSPFDIESIPLWNHESETALPLDSLKTYLKRHEGHVKTYNRNQKREYFQTLKQYGIDQSEWKILKGINKDEGDVSAFFARANDNHSLMSKLIIPSIDKQIEPEYKKTYQEMKSLAETFKEVAIASQEMPELLKREFTYRIMKDELTPITSYLKKCAEIEQELKKHKENGYILKEFMKKEAESKKSVLSHLEDDLQKIDDELNELKWESANLKYAKTLSVIRELEQKKEELTRKYQNYLDRIKKEEEAIQAYTLKLRMKEREQLRKKRTELINKRNELKRILKADDMEHEIALSKESIKNQWDKTRLDWTKTEKEHVHYMEHLREEIRKHKDHQLKVERDIKQMEKTLVQLETLMNLHNELKEEKKGKFGELFVEDSYRYQKDMEAKKKDLSVEYDDLQEGMGNLLTEQKSLQKKFGEVEITIQNLKEKRESLSQEIAEKQKEERELTEELSGVLKEKTDDFSKDTILSFVETLKQLASQTERAIESSLRDKWKWENQYAIMKDFNHWVPNEDLLIVKDQIISQNITCFLGMEVLYQLLEHAGEEVARKEMEKNPLFPYSVVVHEKDMESIDFSFLGNLAFKSPVPILIREHTQKHAISVKQEDEHLYPIHAGMFLSIDEWLQKALDVYAFEEKKKEIDRKADDADFTLAHNKKYLLNLQNVMIRCQTSLNEKNSSVLLKEREEVQQDLHTHQSLLSTIKERLLTIDTEYQQQSENIERIREDISTVSNQLLAIDEWRNKEREYIRFTEETRALRKEISAQNEELSQLKRTIKNAENTYQSYEKDHADWKHAAEEQYITLQQFFDWAENPFQGYIPPSTSDRLEPPTYNEEATDKLKNLLFIHRNLTNQLESKNSELAEISVGIRRVNEDIVEKEKELLELDENWQTQQNPTESKAVLSQSIKTHTDNASDYNKEAQELNVQINRADASIENHRDSLEEAQKQLESLGIKEPESWEDIDLDEKEKEIKRSRDSAKQLRRTVNQMKDVNITLIKELTTGINQLDAMDLEEVSIGDLTGIEWLDGIQQNYQEESHLWTKKCTELSKSQKNLEAHYYAQYEEYKRRIEAVKGLDITIMSKVQSYFEEINIQPHSRRYENVASMLESFDKELERLSKNKDESMEILQHWTDRVTYRINLIIKKLKQSVAKMKIINRNNHPFRLVKFAKNYRFNDNIEQQHSILSDFFIQVIHDLKEDFEDIKDAPLYEIEQRIDISTLVLKALGNQFPTLYIYNPEGQNRLLYSKENESYYSEWATIMGSNDDVSEAAGSGGQKLMTQIIIMAMLMKINKKGWSVLISDNPFSKMVSQHVITPIFALCELLKIQWVVVSPPELTSTFELTKYFPVIHRLSFKRTNGKDVVQDEVHVNKRIYIDNENVLNERKVSSE